ncbi:hypothetical protein [Brevundimonas lenta]|uniref:Uncharacterized protein n=1 Tax=Brevundimonas lenta TaxID=424796 RepID=A0A7W6NNV9_9CAUL|nr:hypothetical protein [Brevundimonas lenta]MBB4081560.1 hypothetical protein [Brevundimonas lenta]
MSAIRTPTPSPLFPTQTPLSPARSSRSTFFQQALDGVKSPVAAAPAAAERPVASVAAPAFEASGERAIRPGSLVDIRV